MRIDLRIFVAMALSATAACSDRPGVAPSATIYDARSLQSIEGSVVISPYEIAITRIEGATVFTPEGPIAGATITCLPPTTCAPVTSDARGEFRVSVPAGGAIRISKDSYMTSDITFLDGFRPAHIFLSRTKTP